MKKKSLTQNVILLIEIAEILRSCLDSAQHLGNISTDLIKPGLLKAHV